MSSVRLEAVPQSVSDIAFQKASVDIWDKKYRLKSKTGEVIDASIDETYKRVAQALSEVETSEEKQGYWFERFLWALRRGAIPAGRITSNAGALAHKPATSTINCTVSGTIRDSMNGILEKGLRSISADERQAILDGWISLKQDIWVSVRKYAIHAAAGQVVSVIHHLLKQ